MDLKIAGATVRALLERARERGVDVERYLANLLASELDPEGRVRLYPELVERRPRSPTPGGTYRRPAKSIGARWLPCSIAERRD